MSHRARTVSMTITVDLKALLYVDGYAEKNRLSRSAAVNELLRLGRAYLKVLEVPDDEKEEGELEVPSLVLEKQRSLVGHMDEWLETQKEAKVLEKKPQKHTKKAKTPKG